VILATGSLAMIGVSTAHALAGSGVAPVVLRIGTIWGPLGDPASPFYPIPSLINKVVRGEEPPSAYATTVALADDGASEHQSCPRR
jgi:nucleoside-diphosphate-sugar epimerase